MDRIFSLVNDGWVEWRSRLKLVFLFLCLSSFILLNGCSTTKSRSDGPPPFHVDETQIPDAVPKPEKLAKYGNMDTYRVFGKTYHVMKSAENFEETGYASWYGFKWHKLRTSSGERYDVAGMTAAHRTLPLPTYIEVTNLKNNRKIIVKVNDRGPFAGNRILDLSYVAAKKLGMIGHGTTRVHIAAIDPSRSPTDNPVFLADNTRSIARPRVNQAHSEQQSIGYLQVGAFKNRLYAENLKRKITSIVSSPVHISQSNLYRVKIGPIHDLATANHITKKLRAIGLKPKKIAV